ncbi:MAG: type IV pilin protein [Flavobacteriales bacterium]|nr:type IV pilin protein [Flavobacteriales bacterium]
MKTKNLLHQKVKGLTLMETLITIIIIGIVSVAVIVNFGGTVTNARAVEAKTQLSHLHSLQKVYFLEKTEYAVSFDDLGYEPKKLVTDGGQGYYAIEIVSADSKNYTARATAVKDFDNDGVMDVWEINGEGKVIHVTKD